mmetsp:Transcript_5561/g.16409  ORF Transcript_5561/g.16409 Transcript_5561/m.16409 type:complete len:275 (+) Transcript_5561:165-989(+)
MLARPHPSKRSFLFKILFQEKRSNPQVWAHAVLHVAAETVHIIWAPKERWDALVDLRRLNVTDALDPSGPDTTSLLEKKSHGIRLVKEPKLPVRRLGVPRIAKDSASSCEKRVYISHESAGVPKVPSAFFVSHAVLHELSDSCIPRRHVPQIEHHLVPASRNAHVPVRVKKLVALRIEGEAVHSIADGQHESGRRSVEAVARSDKAAPWLEKSGRLCGPNVVLRVSEHAKNGARGQTSVDIGRAIKWVKHGHKLAAERLVVNDGAARAWLILLF